MIDGMIQIGFVLNREDAEAQRSSGLCGCNLEIMLVKFFCELTVECLFLTPINRCCKKAILQNVVEVVKAQNVVKMAAEVFSKT